MPGRVFISYRRSDSRAEAGRLHQSLENAFGAEHLFKDVDDIPFGHDFRVVVEDAVARSSVVLVVVGPTFVPDHPQEPSRLDDPDDPVRLEIEIALDRGIRIIPVCVNGAEVPDAERLPEEIRQFVYRNGPSIDHDTWDRDIRPLISALREALGGQEGSSRTGRGGHDSGLEELLPAEPNHNQSPAQTSRPSTALRQETFEWSLHPTDGALAHVKPRERMVRWLDPVEMTKTWWSERRSHDSKRPAPTLPAPPAASFEVGPDEEFWFDYVADMGDGFDGTAPVAWLVGRDRLEIPADRAGELPTPPAFMPRADLLLFGGDEIYPYAAAGWYEAQTELPYRMGLQDGADEGGATLIAIPGNHDWLGGISHFETMFCSERTFAHHWRTVQPHRFWHAKLPQGWWLWGIDTELHNELPDEQLRYFEHAARELGDGDRVILLTPVPLWQLRQKYPKHYVRLRSKLDPLIRAQGATMPLALSGDTHCFAHLERIDTDGEDHVMAGGGGAFLQPTHNLAERIPTERGNAEFKLMSRWPVPADSRELAPAAARITEPQYVPLILIAGGLQAAFAGLVRLGPRLWGPDPSEDVGWPEVVEQSLSSPWALLMLLLVTLAGVVSLKGNSLEPKLGKAAQVYGLIVGAGMAASLLVIDVVRRWIGLDPGDGGGAQQVVGWLGAVVLGGAFTIAIFLWLSQWANGRIKAGDSLVFTRAHSTRFKHFLRCRIDREGDLTVYAIGIDPVGEGWYDAMTKDLSVPPHDPAGIPRLHYVWGKTYRKFTPEPINIAISISDVGTDTTEPSEGKDRLQAVFMEVCADLIDGGHTLIFGGWPYPQEGHITRLREIDQARHRDNPNAQHHLVEYVPDYLWERRYRIGSSDGDQLMRAVRVTRGRPAGESDVARVTADLTAMRERMARDARVCIAIGGNTQPGRPGERLAPGVIEDAVLAIDAGLPLIVAGGFGGASRLIAEALLDDLDETELHRQAAHFIEPARLGQMLRRFDSLSVLRNGLNDGENEELLTSGDVDTVTALVLRSIDRIVSYRRWS